MTDKPFATTELNPLPDAVQELIAERDEWKTRCEFSFEQRDKLTAERDAAREAVISNCARVMTVTTERDALKDAARLALDLINDLEPLYWDTRKDKQRHTDTIAALKAVL